MRILICEICGSNERFTFSFREKNTNAAVLVNSRIFIIDEPETPIIDEGEAEPNVTFLEQLIMSAEAAVECLVGRRVAHCERIAIGRNSYGSAMAVNLLAHAPKLLCCGIARSGAYNRTLTSFGFQSESRTLWESQEVYQRMSACNYADRITSQLLFNHGEDINNPGKYPMQSERLYQALKGHRKIVIGKWAGLLKASVADQI